jgi:predicted DNA-binding protein
MAYTSIRVTTEVRDRLALIADQRGISLGKLLMEFAEKTLTPEELKARGEAVQQFLEDTYGQVISDEDVEAAREWLDSL